MAKNCTVLTFPPNGPWDTGVRINNAAGYAAGTTATMAVDDIYNVGGDASDIFAVMDDVYIKRGNKFLLLGTCSATGTSTTIRILHATGGSLQAVLDNEILYSYDLGGIVQAQAKDGGGAIGKGSVECEVVRGELMFIVTQDP